MILLDTNAVLWLHTNHRRGRRLQTLIGQLHVSPASLLEIQLLVEIGRIRLRAGRTVGDLADDGRWTVDDPSAAEWFLRALEVGWTRDPFDRLLVAHAVLRSWRVATGDGELLERLGPARTIEL